MDRTVGNRHFQGRNGWMYDAAGAVLLALAINLPELLSVTFDDPEYPIDSGALVGIALIIPLSFLAGTVMARWWFALLVGVGFAFVEGSAALVSTVGLVPGLLIGAALRMRA